MIKIIHISLSLSEHLSQAHSLTPASHSLTLASHSHSDLSLSHSGLPSRRSASDPCRPTPSTDPARRRDRSACLGWVFFFVSPCCGLLVVVVVLVVVMAVVVAVAKGKDWKFGFFFFFLMRTKFEWCFKPNKALEFQSKSQVGKVSKIKLRIGKWN